ncbi:pleckstrin homology domain-containing family G member 3 isoform X2 [Puntigrus tetrazona]|uniref:pleckstrin homology domain-containing family G member 3 isoform X2 n=1 Tax=Puntigrus tetrazona TaxID=1606681 RepID=UPI001C8967DF|nr:pleckstrin homology domain-containing family G member 3 isoform X2 [Puntigrus tetrazona]XP_043076079.1 pleckstrin homology domain-containing family G member 3 isoform X2 [Puntigrus tetrazona]XP_043076080.1 pleckstrin homology domain-containing family G member 3 isoform X2 [Puntigrus tetrazona]
MPEKSHSTAHDIPMGEESPRLSTASFGSNDRSSTATLSDCSDFTEVQRPVSVVSTISSGSCSSREDVLPSSIPLAGVPIEDNVNLLLTAAADPETQDTSFTQATTLFLQQNSSSTVNNNSSSSSVSNSFTPFAASTMAPNPELTYLDRVVMEIIETERMYVRDLRSIVEDYLAHIIDIADLPIKPEQVCALFGNIEDIYEFNSELLQSLDMCDNDPVAIARCFVIKHEYFDIYTQYCTNYPNSVAALTDCMRNKTLAKFFRERQAALKRSLPLGSYLLKPVQRILKYHLLLQEIAKHFDPEEEGYEVVEEAIYTMTGVAWYINDMKRKHEHAVRLQEVQSLLINWKGPDLTTYGELVLEGTFRVHRAKNERTLFLFDRMLLITKRRGEHYVYKTHISCSTLMLIESAKDSLCFSVTHYKHPKQPHSVQAKTVEEKKLWAHHIKRLILENHQAVIPQKAKEAILEMDSIYKKYRYSPERLKKSVSCQSEEFSNSRQGRRQSEPSKEILKNTKVILKHSDSEGALAADRWPLQATASISTLGLCESSDEKPVAQDEYSPEALIPSDNEELIRASPSLKARLMQENGDKAEGEGSDSDDILMEDNQVADFASSMLAAISCWHYRARALLTMDFTMEEGGCENTENFKVENSSSVEQVEAYLKDEKYISEQDKSQNLETSYWGSTEKLKPDVFCDPESKEIDKQVPNIQDLESARDKDDQLVPKEEVSSLLQQEDAPGDSSEEEEDIERKPDTTSILPSSVLDKASAIAEHFVSNARRSSISTEEMRSLGCLSPRLPSRTGSTISLGDAHEHQSRLASTCSESHGVPLTQESLASADFMIGSSGEDNLFDSDRTICRRRDSVLSRQDQLLIDKIRSYYENAEHQDAAFSLKRRESLTYIPSGLVRNSVTRFNSIPKDKGLALEKTGSTSGPVIAHNSITETILVASALSENNANPANLEQPVICASTDFSKHDRNEDLFDSDVDGSIKLESKVGSHEEEVFRPSSEMIKVWQDMEKEITRCQGDLKALRPREIPYFRGTSPSLSRKDPCQRRKIETKVSDGLIMFEDSDLSTIREESATLLAFKEKENRAASESDAIKPREWEDEGRPLRVLAPRVIQLRAETEHERDTDAQAEHADSSQNKVFNLARKYSQRIKCTQPMLRQRSQESGDTWLTKRNLLSVVEEKPEKESKVKADLMFSMTPYDQPDPEGDQKAKVMTPSPDHTSVSSPKVLSPHLSHSRSPLSPPPESFNWPDVRELCSKYAHLGSSSAQPPVSQSRSVEEQMFDSSSRRRSSFSSSRLVTSNGSTDSSVYKFYPGDTGELLTRTQRAGSLDQKLGSLYLNDLQSLQSKNASSGFYISAQATLPNEKNIIVVEKVPPVDMDLSTQECKKEEITDGIDDSYVLIRSPTSREKISIVAVIDRCRAYQESEEYRLREDGGSKAEQLYKIDRCKKTEKASSCSEHSDNAVKNTLDPIKKADSSHHSVVKNLREKFQNTR